MGTLVNILSSHHLDIGTLEEDNFPAMFIERGRSMLAMVGKVMQKDLGDGEAALRGSLREAGLEIASEQDDMLDELLRQERSDDEKEYDEFGEFAYATAVLG